MRYNMMLLCDFYKVFHRETYHKDMTMMYSTWTPRSNKYFPEADKVVWFGLQGFLKWVNDEFKENFFDREIDAIIDEYELYIRHTFNENATGDHLRELHKLGYLPLKVCAIPEGTRVPFRVPCATIQNTDPRFAWLTNWLETLWSCSMWLPTTSATTAYTFRKIIEEYVEKTSDKPFWNHVGCGDFSYRGMTSLESAITSAAAFLTSFTKTSTIPSIQYLCEYYNADVTKEDIGSWSASVEHSCTTSNFAVDGNEEDFFVKMCTDICKNRPFSFVADSYDYFNFLDVIVRKNKDIVAAHGAVRIRPDSGDPVDIICGTKDNVDENSTLEELGTLRILDDIFGHTVNSKGYKVLNGGIGIVYGDAITLDRCKAICAKMDKMGWAIENVIFGVGSYSLQYRTRDSQGWAYKATYGEINGEPIMIFKDPKTDRVAGEAMKKSQRGMVYVYTDTDGEIKFQDGYTRFNIPDGNMLEVVYENGKLIRDESLAIIRNRLHHNQF